MKGADKEKRATLARALAEGLNVKHAAKLSGYGRQTVYRLRAEAAFGAEVEKLRDELAWGGSTDLAPVINELVRYARQAAELKSAAALNVARQLLVETARLKQAMSGQVAAAAAKAAEDAHQAELDDWLATYGPKS
ncbi:MAG TPA: helix-turn-helix domain-containing protein [Caulobacteraceae bacterium]